jgi:tetratricopeptide (TPR) repeat protein
LQIKRLPTSCLRGPSVMSKKDNKVLQFPGKRPHAKADYQRVKSLYTVSELRQLFGLSERMIRRWTEQGVIHPVAGSDQADPRYDFQTLTQLRRVRELRSQGFALKRVEAELQGQMNLFKPTVTRVAHILSPFEEALMLHEQGDKRAAELYREAISTADNVADAYCNLGIIELESGSTAKAFDCFAMSLKNEPRHVEAHYNLANLYFDAGDLKLAKLHYESGRELEPSFSPLHYNLALVYYELNDLAAAQASLQRYKDLAPEDEVDSIEELLGWLEKAQTLRPTEREPRNSQAN